MTILFKIWVGTALRVYSEKIFKKLKKKLFELVIWFTNLNFL